MCYQENPRKIDGRTVDLVNHTDNERSPPQPRVRTPRSALHFTYFDRSSRARYVHHGNESKGWTLNEPMLGLRMISHVSANQIICGRVVLVPKINNVYRAAFYPSPPLSPPPRAPSANTGRQKTPHTLLPWQLNHFTTTPKTCSDTGHMLFTRTLSMLSICENRRLYMEGIVGMMSVCDDVWQEGNGVNGNAMSCLGISTLISNTKVWISRIAKSIAKMRHESVSQIRWHTSSSLRPCAGLTSRVIRLKPL